MHEGAPAVSVTIRRYTGQGHDKVCSTEDAREVAHLSGCLPDTARGATAPARLGSDCAGYSSDALAINVSGVKVEATRCVLRSTLTSLL